MPSFEDAADEAEELVEDIAPEVAEGQDEATVETAEETEDQIVTLHVTPDDRVDTEDDVLAAVTFATTEPKVETPSAEVTPDVVEETAPEVAEEASSDIAPEPEETPVEPEVAETAPEVEPVKVTPVPAAPAPAADRRSRVKTTFLGFERADTHVQELIETAAPVAKGEATQQSFPVGWLVVTSGPGRGACVTVTEGLMQIGRNDDQAIQLDFGDTGISRSNHAVIAYDPEDRKCYLGHGGKANLVRLNGKPVLSTVPLSNGDMIRISETSIRFMAFCDDGFDWRDAD
jgi:hypothetical protein